MRIVVVGTGSIGMRHLGILRAMPNIDVLAVPARPERVAELRALGIAAAVTVADAVDFKPDGAIVATDTGRHATDAQTLLASCPLLVEKPLAVSTGEASTLLSAARASGHPVHVACCLRFDAGLAWAHDRIPAIGVPRLLDVECLSWLPSWRPKRDHSSSYSSRAGEGGVLLDLIHEIDSCCWFAGSLSEVTAQLENQGAVGIHESLEETALITGRHASGLPSTIRLSYAIRPPTRRLRMWGSDGMVEWDGIQRRASRRDGDGVERETFSWEGPDTMYRAQTETWLGSLAGQPSARLVDGAQGLYEVAVVEASKRSAATGRREKVV